MEFIVAKCDTDPKKIIGDLFDYVEQYRKASAAMDGVKGTFAATTQIRGQLLELSFKTYLAACGTYQEGHNLVELANIGEAYGLELTERDWEHIQRLNEKYAVDDVLDWRYPSRYPMEDRPTVIWITPGHEQMDDLIDRILDQAADKGPEQTKHRERSQREASS